MSEQRSAPGKNPVSLPDREPTRIEQRDHPPGPESRTIDVDVTELDTRGRTIVGYAAVYNRESRDLGGFRERIAPGAFDGVLEDSADVRCLLNHDPNIVLGRTAAGTLRLASEERGLRFECDLPESRADLRESVSRGDLDGASFRFEVGRDSWSGDLRTVEQIRELHDVSLASYPAYPAASVELRTDPTRSSSSPSRRNAIAGDTGGLVVRDRSTLRVSDRNDAAAGTRSLAQEFRAAGFPGEMASIPFGEFRDVTLNSGTTADVLNVSSQSGVALGADERFAFTAFPSVPVEAGVTSVSVMRQTSRDLADPGDVRRDIDQTDAKPETSSVIEVQPRPMIQVATKQSGIPNVYLELDLVNSVIETDLRLAVNDGLDSLVLESLGGAANQAPGSDKLLVSIRKAMTTIRAAGYNPDTLIVTPANDEALDTTVAVTGSEDYVFGPGTPAGGIWGLRRFVSKTVAAPIVADSSAVGRLYASPVTLQRFEENDGATNTSLVRLELHALFGVERIAAAVRIAAS